MRYLSISEVLELHERLIASSGGSTGIRNLGALESAVSQPHATFAQQDLFFSCYEPSLRGREQTRWSCGHGDISSSQ